MPYNIQEMLLGSLQDSAKHTNALNTETSTLNSILTKMGVLNDSTQTAIDDKTKGTITVEGQALAGAQGVQEATLKFAQAAGSDIQSPSDILVELGNNLRNQIQAAQSAQKNIQAKESLRIIDNPLNWLAGQITVGEDYNQYNRAAEAANLTSQGITAVTKATDEVSRTQESLARKVTDASRAAAAQVRIAEGVALKNVAEQDHLKSEMAVAQAITQNSAAQAAESQRQFNLVASAEGLENERESMRLRREQFNWEKQAKNAATAKTAEAEKTKAQLLAEYNVGAKVLGLPVETSWDLAYTRAQLGGTAQSRFSAVMEAGGNSVAAGGARVSATPAGAASMMAQGVFPRSTEAGFEPMKKYLRDVTQRAIVPGAKPADTVANINTLVKAETENFTKNATAPGSFYAPPALGSILATASVQATPLYKKVLSVAGKDLTTADPTAIVTLAYSAVKAGTLSPEQAAKGINEVYGQAVNINNSEKKFAQIGIPSQTSFNTKPDIWGKDEAANLTDYSSTLRLLTIMKSREWAKKLQGSGLMLPAAL